MPQSWSLDWSHGQVTVHAGAAALGRTRFRLEDGRSVEPFHEAPWITAGETVEPGLENLRGDWPCLPFGRLYGADDPLVGAWRGLVDAPLPAAAHPLGASDRLLHGFSAAAPWTLVSLTAEAITLGLDYPGDSPIERITRRIRPIDGEAGLDVSVEIQVRHRCIRPFGFHPNFALCGEPGSFRIEPGPYRFGLTHPVAEPAARARPDSRFSALSDVAVKTGGSERFDRLPFADDREDILQLCGIEGGVHLVDEHERVAWDLSWDTDKLPSCLLWMSNRGRKFPPWNGRHLCVGVEPVASAFDFGSVIGAGDNPIALAGVRTAIEIEPETPLTLGYRIRGHALAGG
ncbi:hypothetical protein [Labrys neptuniae]